MAEFSGKYASDVRWYCEQRLSGKVKCNEYQLKGIERFYRDLENDKYEFDSKDADFVIGIIEKRFVTCKVKHKKENLYEDSFSFDAFSQIYRV